MIYGAKNGSIAMDGDTMDYVVFGKGKRTLVMLPGLGDGLRNARGMALPFALAYRRYAKDFRVYIFSRKNRLAVGCTSRDMAGDQKRAMDILGISGADVLGISQGGAVAQWLAIDYPEKVDRLILAVTTARKNSTLNAAVRKWMGYAREKNYRDLVIDVNEKSHTEGFLKKFRLLYPLLTRVGKPRSYRRFLIMARACLTHEAIGEVHRISCPVLVIGGRLDNTIDVGESEALAGAIRGSGLYIYEDYGHGLYWEAKDFHRRVREFFAV